MNYQIRSGIAKEYREDAARLYAIAFEKKFEKLFRVLKKMCGVV